MWCNWQRRGQWLRRSKLACGSLYDCGRQSCANRAGGNGQFKGILRTGRYQWGSGDDVPRRRQPRGWSWIFMSKSIYGDLEDWNWLSDRKGTRLARTWLDRYLR